LSENTHLGKLDTAFVSLLAVLTGVSHRFRRRARVSVGAPRT